MLFSCAIVAHNFFFTNQLVEGLGTIFGWLHFSHTRPFWPKGKKYILKNIKIIFCFYKYSSSSCCFRARLLSGKFFFANQLVEGLGTIFGWVHISHTRHFWPKGKKYILKNIKKNCAFYDFFRFLGSF